MQTEAVKLSVVLMMYSVLTIKTNKKPSVIQNLLSPVRTLGMVQMTGLEPARRGHQILSLARLPIPPHLQGMKFNLNNYSKNIEVCQGLTNHNYV